MNRERHDLAIAVLDGSARHADIQRLAELTLAEEKRPSPLPWSVETRTEQIDEHGSTWTMHYVVDAHGVTITADLIGSEAVVDFGQANAELIVEAVNAMVEPGSVEELVGGGG